MSLMQVAIFHWDGLIFSLVYKRFHIYRKLTALRSNSSANMLMLREPNVNSQAQALDKRRHDGC